MFSMEKVISVAPMMDWTDRHCRYFHRLLAPSILLYTEMVTANALVHGDVARHLTYSEQEHPLILQLGGSDPDALAQAIKIAEPFEYDGYNLNCGCPSDRVQNGAFGACLMAEPDIVAQCIKSMKDATNKSVTVKCRIGIDEADENEMLRKFIDTVSEAGCDTFIIHARKAWLKGLSPKENRDIPPLNYDLVSDIKTEYPHLNIELNGGLIELSQLESLNGQFDGFMIGRAAYHTPRILVDLEKRYYQQDWMINDEAIIHKMINYADQQNAQYGTPIQSVTRHMINFYQNVKGARQWRRTLSEQARFVHTAADVLLPAFDAVRQNA